MIYVLIGAVVIFLLFALAIATYSTAQLEDSFEKCNNVPCNRKITGGVFALQLTNNNFNSQINVGRTQGYLNDGYSSKSRMVVLSDATCDTSSVGALTVVAHEFGHAEQDLTNSKKFKLNKTLSKIVKIIGYFMFPFAIVGLFLFLVFPEMYYIGLSCLGVSLGIFLLAVVLKLATIPLEKDASKRGLRLLKETGTFDEEELKLAKELLNSALLTYVGDFLRSILWWTFLTKKSKLF